MNIIRHPVGVLSSSTPSWLMRALCEHYLHKSNQNLPLFVQHVLDAPDLFLCADERYEFFFEFVEAFVTDGKFLGKTVTKEELEVLAECAELVEHETSQQVGWSTRPTQFRTQIEVDNFEFSDILEAGKHIAIARAPEIQLHAWMMIVACFYILSHRDDPGRPESLICELVQAYMHVWGLMDEARFVSDGLSLSLPSSTNL